MGPLSHPPLPPPMNAGKHGPAVLQCALQPWPPLLPPPRTHTQSGQPRGHRKAPRPNRTSLDITRHVCSPRSPSRSLFFTVIPSTIASWPTVSAPRPCGPTAAQPHSPTSAHPQRPNASSGFRFTQPKLKRKNKILGVKARRHERYNSEAFRLLPENQVALDEVPTAPSPRLPGSEYKSGTLQGGRGLPLGAGGKAFRSHSPHCTAPPHKGPCSTSGSWQWIQQHTPPHFWTPAPTQRVEDSDSNALTNCGCPGGLSQRENGMVCVVICVIFFCSK